MAETPARTSRTTPRPIETTNEHALGDDTGRTPDAEGFHDSISGKPVDEQGRFLDGTEGGPIEPSHIVANNWPALQSESDKSDATPSNS